MYRTPSVEKILRSSIQELIIVTVPNRLCGQLLFNLSVYFMKSSMHGIFPSVKAMQIYFLTTILHEHTTILLRLPIIQEQRKTALCCFHNDSDHLEVFGNSIKMVLTSL